MSVCLLARRPRTSRQERKTKLGIDEASHPEVLQHLQPYFVRHPEAPRDWQLCQLEPQLNQLSPTFRPPRAHESRSHKFVYSVLFSPAVVFSSCSRKGDCVGRLLGRYWVLVFVSTFLFLSSS